MEPTMLAGLAVATVGLATMAAGAVSAAVDRRQRGAAAYLRRLDGAAGDRGEAVLDEFSQRLARPFLDRVLSPLLARIVAAAGSITPSDHRIRIRTQLAQAGLDLRRRPEEVMAAQVAGAASGLVAGLALLLGGALGAGPGTALTALLMATGGFVPMAWLGRKVEERMRSIRTDLPDTLDLLAISVEAGIGLEGAMEVVTERFRSPLAEEMARTLQEMGLGLTRRDALGNLKRRSPVPELSSFVQALIQADALGMPLGRVLKLQAAEMRSRRRQWARERAAKLPVKILFPLVACIFPAVLVVVLGPAISQIGQAL
ncbi:MAG: type secretion system protein [Acidimicrobiales bacterium]|nr:type secretion system protein [Acidimicrobiales bacterium]